MKTQQFRRWLQSQGVRIESGTRHDKLYYEGRQSVLPRHAGDLPEGTRRAIIKQLGLTAH